VVVAGAVDIALESVVAVTVAFVKSARVDLHLWFAVLTEFYI
jgi:hypothetical protein